MMYLVDLAFAVMFVICMFFTHMFIKGVSANLRNDSKTILDKDNEN
jgi:hypothetical protein